MLDVLETRSTDLEHLSVVECWAVLADSPLGRIATVGREGVELLPVNHAVDRHRIVVRTEAGGWLHDAADGRELVFESDGSDEHTAWGAVAAGWAGAPEAPEGGVR